MKIKPLVPKKLKYNMMKFKIDITRPIAKDSDKDGIPNYLDCAPFDSSKQGLLHGYFKKRRIEKEMREVDKIGLPPSDRYREELETGLSEAEQELEEGKEKWVERGEQVGEVTKQYGENIKKAGKEIQKGFSASAKHYSKQAESRQSDPRMQKPEVTRGVHYLIPASIACRKMYHDENTGLPSSIPKYKRDVYTAFSPKTVGGEGPFMPHRAPNPPWLQEKQRQRELIREYLRLKAIQDARGGQ